MDVTLPDGRVIPNVPEGTTRSELMRRVAAYDQQQHVARVDAQRARDRAEYDPTKGMSGLEKVAANVGAGLDTTLQGVKQLAGKVGLGEGLSDEDLRAKREIDRHLASQTTGGGALQTVGEAAPMLLIPGAGLIGGAAAGAAGGALQPVTSNESRLVNAGVGGAFGGALGKVFPHAVNLAKTVGSSLRSAAAGPELAVRRALQEAAGRGPEALQALQAYLARGADKVPLSSAAAAKSPGLAQLEIAKRATSPAEFVPLEQAQGASVFKKTLDATQAGTKKNIEDLRGARKAEWESNWQTAMQVADPEVFAKEVPKFRAKLDKAFVSTESSNPAVRNLVSEISNEMDRLGPHFGPGNLQQIRANLNARGKPSPLGAYESAPRESAAVDSLITEMDRILNKTTDGAWDAVKGGYELSSKAVNEAKAASRVRGKFVNEAGEPVIQAMDAEGAVPRITEQRMRTAIEGSRDRAGREMLSPEAAAQLREPLQALTEQNITQRLKGTATAGGGSATEPTRQMVGKLPFGKTLLNFDEWLTNQPTREQLLTNALRDPEVMHQQLTQSPGVTTKVGNLLGDTAEKLRLKALVKQLREPVPGVRTPELPLWLNDEAVPRALGTAGGVDIFGSR